MEGQRYGDRELGGPNPTCGGYKMEGYLGSRGSQPHTRQPSPGSQHQEDKSLISPESILHWNQTDAYIPLLWRAGQDLHVQFTQ